MAVHQPGTTTRVLLGTCLPGLWPHIGGPSQIQLGRIQKILSLQLMPRGLARLVGRGRMLAASSEHLSWRPKVSIFIYPARSPLLASGGATTLAPCLLGILRKPSSEPAASSCPDFRKPAQGATTSIKGLVGGAKPSTIACRQDLEQIVGSNPPSESSRRVLESTPRTDTREHASVSHGCLPTSLHLVRSWPAPTAHVRAQRAKA